MTERPVVFVTGASGGIGRAVCLEFSKRGYDVALTSPDADSLNRIASEVQAEGVQTIALPGDLTDFNYIASAVQQTINRFGRVDALINNAAWREIVTMRAISEESWSKTLEICLTAPAFLTRQVATNMELRRSGVIINVSSLQSRRPAGISPAYAACKGALDSLTYELAALWGPCGIRVVGVNPGAIDTRLSSDYPGADDRAIDQLQHEWSEDMIPLRRWGTPEEVAKTIAFLASDDASYITGTSIFIDGGITNQLSPYSVKHRLFPDEFRR